jgi:hypothetical protein
LFAFLLRVQRTSLLAYEQLGFPISVGNEQQVKQKTFLQLQIFFFFMYV